MQRAQQVAKASEIPCWHSCPKGCCCQPASSPGSSCSSRQARTCHAPVSGDCHAGSQHPSACPLDHPSAPGHPQAALAGHPPCCSPQPAAPGFLSTVLALPPVAPVPPETGHSPDCLLRPAALGLLSAAPGWLLNALGVLEDDFLQR